MLALGVGGATMAPAVALPLMAAGAGAKKLAEGMTRSNAKQLERIIAGGGTRAAIEPAKNMAQRAIEAKRAELARLLMAGGLYSNAQ